MKRKDDLPDHKKFGYDRILEDIAIEEELIASGKFKKGDPMMIFAVSRQHIENHKNDLTFSQRQDLARYNGEKWVTPNPDPNPPKQAFLTTDEIGYLIEYLNGANHPTGMDILEKLKQL
jgi:hypothetical protein